MTQTATAPDGVGLVIYSGAVVDGNGKSSPYAMLYEDGQQVGPPGLDRWASAADARAAAWEHYVARWKDDPDWHPGRPPEIHKIKTPGWAAIIWKTRP